MEITITQTKKPIPVTIMHLDGTLDGSNHQSMLEEAKKQYNAGARNLLLDLSKLAFISSAGLGALHQVALLFRGKKHPAQDETWAAYRWAAYRTIDRDHQSTSQEHVKLLSPTKPVLEVLDLIGFSGLFEIFTDPDQAVASFH
jgi:anti-anti-sigma factor